MPFDTPDNDAEFDRGDDRAAETRDVAEQLRPGELAGQAQDVEVRNVTVDHPLQPGEFTGGQEVSFRLVEIGRDGSRKILGDVAISGVKIVGGIREGDRVAVRTRDLERRRASSVRNLTTGSVVETDRGALKSVQVLVGVAVGGIALFVLVFFGWLISRV